MENEKKGKQATLKQKSEIEPTDVYFLTPTQVCGHQKPIVSFENFLVCETIIGLYTKETRIVESKTVNLLQIYFNFSAC